MQFGSVSEGIRLTWQEGTVGYGQAKQVLSGWPGSRETKRYNRFAFSPALLCLGTRPAAWHHPPSEAFSLLSVICGNVLEHAAAGPPPPDDFRSHEADRED